PEAARAGGPGRPRPGAGGTGGGAAGGRRGSGVTDGADPVGRPGAVRGLAGRRGDARLGGPPAGRGGPVKRREEIEDRGTATRSASEGTRCPSLALRVAVCAGSATSWSAPGRPARA